MMGSGRTCVLGIETYQILSTGAEFLFGVFWSLVSWEPMQFPWTDLPAEQPLGISRRTSKLQVSEGFLLGSAVMFGIASCSKVKSGKMLPFFLEMFGDQTQILFVWCFLLQLYFWEPHE